MPEVLPEQQTEFSRLDVKIKNRFQIELMKTMAVKEHQHDLQFEWVEKYAEQVSDLITFDPEIRPLVESEDEEKRKEAIEMVKERLGIET